MKKLNIFLILILFLISCNFLGQRAKGSSVNYEYYRLPLQKVQEKKYFFEVDISYKNDYEQDLALHKQNEQEIEKEYEEVSTSLDAIKKEMEAKYEDEENKAEDEYQEALKEYNSMSTGDKVAQRILLKDDGKPAKREIGPPPTNKDFADKLDIKYKDLIGSDYLPKKRYLAPFEFRDDIPSDADLTSGIDLQGFKKINDEGLKIKMDAMDYALGIEVKKKGEEPNVTKTAHINVSVDVIMTVYNESGDEILTKTQTIKSMVKSPSKKVSDWNNYESSSAYKSLILKQKKAVIKSCVSSLNSLINNEFGYAWINKSSRVYTGTGKKLDYSDLDQAQVDFKNGLNDIRIDKESAHEKFNKAIEVWKKSLDEELDTDNKKARINNKVGAALYINLALAYTLMDDFDNADKVITEVQSNSSFKGGDIKEAETVRKFMSDQRIRFSN